jgi:hypothetical protein
MLTRFHYCCWYLQARMEWPDLREEYGPGFDAQEEWERICGTESLYFLV